MSVRNVIAMAAILCMSLSCFSIGAIESKMQKRVCFRIRFDYIGESEGGKRVQLAAKNLGWHADLRSIHDTNIADESYDWVLTSVPGEKAVPNQKNYMLLFDPEKNLYNDSGTLQDPYLTYDVYMTTFSLPSVLQEDLEGRGKVIWHRRWYPTVQYRPYQEVSPTKLFYILPHWGSRTNYVYKKMMKYLNKTDYIQFYGRKEEGALYPKSYRGTIPFDGVSLVDRMAEAGVTLVLHDSVHYKYAIPTGRIFEAAAASTVIISDKNPFVVEHFGDAVLYVDLIKSGKAIFDQIDAHMKWIQKHPKEALEKAKRCYEIYQEKFVLEDQLLSLDDFHNELNSL